MVDPPNPEAHVTLRPLPLGRSDRSRRYWYILRLSCSVVTVILLSSGSDLVHRLCILRVNKSSGNLFKMSSENYL